MHVIIVCKCLLYIGLHAVIIVSFYNMYRFRVFIMENDIFCYY